MKLTKLFLFVLILGISLINQPTQCINFNTVKKIVCSGAFWGLATAALVSSRVDYKKFANKPKTEKLGTIAIPISFGLMVWGIIEGIKRGNFIS